MPPTPEDLEHLALFREKPNLKKDPFFNKTTGVEKCWVGENVTGAPINQKKCHACVYCVTCDLLTAYLALQMVWAHRYVTLFAPQYPLDCMKSKRDPDECGCRETTFEEVFKFFMSRGGVEEYVYKFRALRGGCKDADCKDVWPPPKWEQKIDYIPADTKRVKLDKFLTCPVQDFSEMKKNINNGPVGAILPWTPEFDQFGINAKFGDPKSVFKQEAKTSQGSSTTSTKKSKRGKGKELKDVKTKDLGDHAVLIIGYGTEPDTNIDFYIIKNSWSAYWGYHGYAKVAVNYFKGKAYYPNVVTFQM